MPDKTIRERAIEFHNQGYAIVDYDKTQAYRLLCSAVIVDSTMAHSLFWLGNACADMKMLPASIAAFRRLLALPDGQKNGDCTPDLRAKTLVNLGHRMQQIGNTDEAEVVTRQAIKMLDENPDLDKEGRAFAWTNMSLIKSTQAKVEEALEYALIGFEKSQEPIIETGLGFAYLYVGDYARGLRHFEARFPYKLTQYLSYPYKRWDGGRLEGTLFVAVDQGLGDTLSCARFIPEAAKRVDRLIVQTQPELLRMLTQGLLLNKNVTVEPASTIFPIADAWCPIMSLPLALGLTTEQIRDYPQGWSVGQTQIPVERGWKDPNARLHIGIAYGGARMNETDNWRSIPVEMFMELFQVPGIALYSLQVGERVQDLHAAGMAGMVRDMSPWIRDAMDTAALIRELDIVITVESFVGHLCGAIGKTCWVLVSTRGGDWRLGRSGEKSLWYDRHRLFRQGPDGEWGPVFERLVEALNARIASR